VGAEAKISGLDELTAQFYAPDLYSNGETWNTDPEAPPESFAGQLHRARLDLDTWRGSGAGQADECRIGFEPASDLLKAEFPNTPWLVSGVLPEKAVVAIAGEPKTTKTWAGLEVAIALSSGTKAFGEFSVPRPRGVAVFLAEDDRHSVRNRLRALAHARRLSPEEAVQQVYVRCRHSLDLQCDQHLCSLIASVRMLPDAIGLLILDPLRDLHQAEEDKSGPMSDVMGRLRALRDILDCAVVFIHHTSKSSRDTNARREGQRMRGSSAIHGAVDGGIYMSLSEEAENNWKNKVLVELKAARGAGWFTLTLEVEDDANGEAQKARWTFAKVDTSKAGDDLRAKIIQVLRAERQRNPTNPKPIPAETLRRRVEAGTPRVNAALRELEAAGRARQAIRGFKSCGWVYLPSLEESGTPAIRTDSNSSEPVGLVEASRPEPPPLEGFGWSTTDNGHVVRPPQSSDPLAETVQRLEEGQSVPAPRKSAQNSAETTVATKPGTSAP
jgi:hypothetical protein